jgi:hypothetical protein
MTNRKNVCILSIAWGNPYTEPPQGQPRTLWAASIIDDSDGEDIRSEHAPATTPGDGWAHCWTAAQKEIKRWSPERKARTRRTRLRRRLDRKTPLLADVLFDAELERRPDYFDADAIAKQDAETDQLTNR